ncbi:hypothetical protein GGU11DRAFT_751330, partial [Lentinula aff. detonsa]
LREVEDINLDPDADLNLDPYAKEDLKPQSEPLHHVTSQRLNIASGTNKTSQSNTQVTVPIPQSPPKPSPSVDNAPKPHVDSFSDSDSSDAPSIHTPARTYNWHAWQISRTRASKKRRRKMRKTSPSPTPTRRRQKDTQAPVHHPSSTLPSKPSPPIPPIPVQSQPSDETLLDSLQWFTSNKDWTIQAGRLGLKIRDQDTEGPEFVKHCKALLEDTIGRWNPPVPSPSLMKQAWQVLLLKDRAMLGALISLMKVISLIENTPNFPPVDLQSWAHLRIWFNSAVSILQNSRPPNI